MSETLETAYDTAVAVLTVPVSFVEWTTLEVRDRKTPPANSDDWRPLGVRLFWHSEEHQHPEEYQWEPTTSIQGERYIYVFARRAWAVNDTPTLVEVLHLKDGDENERGELEAALLGDRRFPDTRPLHAFDSPLPMKPQWISVGKTIRFVRRFRGARLLHYFFASRIPLSRNFVQELRENVEKWVPPIRFDDYKYEPPTQSELGVTLPSTFGEWDLNVVNGKGLGALQVPVLDPVTIALHLHVLASSARNGLFDYVTVYEGQNPKAREQVQKRQQKLVLAQLVSRIIQDQEGAVNKTLSKLPGAEPHYTASGEIGAVKRNAASFLRSYREQVDYRVAETERWWRYLSNWYLSDPIEFLSRAHYELPEQDWPKFLIPLLICLREAASLIPGRGLLKELIQNTHRYPWFARDVIPGYHGEQSTGDTLSAVYPIPRRFALAIVETVKEVAPLLVEWKPEGMFRVLGRLNRWEINILVDGKTITDPVAAAKSWENAFHNLGLEADAHDLIEEWEEQFYQPFRRKWLPLTTSIELIDLIFSIREFVKERTLVTDLTFAGSIAGMSALLLEFANTQKGALLTKLAATEWLGAISGAIDIVVNLIKAGRAAERHDWTGVAAFTIGATGAYVSTCGIVGSVLLKIPAGPWVIAGLVLMGIGAIISLFNDTPLETFLKLCAFGADGGGDEPIVEGLGVMRKGDYGQHLEVLINLICLFRFEGASTDNADKLKFDERMVLVTMGWVPEGATLEVKYEEEWKVEDTSGSWNDTKKFSFGKGGVPIDGDRQFPLKLSRAPFLDSGLTPFLNVFHAHFSAQLHVSVEGHPFDVPPQPVKFKIDIPFRKKD